MVRHSKKEESSESEYSESSNESEDKKTKQKQAKKDAIKKAVKKEAKKIVEKQIKKEVKKQKQKEPEPETESEYYYSESEHEQEQEVAKEQSSGQKIEQPIKPIEKPKRPVGRPKIDDIIDKPYKITPEQRKDPNYKPQEEVGYKWSFGGVRGWHKVPLVYNGDRAKMRESQKAVVEKRNRIIDLAEKQQKEIEDMKEQHRQHMSNMEIFKQQIEELKQGQERMPKNFAEKIDISLNEVKKDIIRSTSRQRTTNDWLNGFQ